MKKIIALLLAVIMVMGLATVVSADTVDTNVDTSTWKAAARDEAIKLHKVYTVTGSTNAALYPTETLKFTVAVPEGVKNPDTPMVTVDDLVVSGNTDQDIVINLPEYDTVGVYDYVITENKGTAQAVGYTDATIAVKVLVEYDYDNTELKSTIVLATVKQEAEGEDGKEDTFTNTYDVGKLTVQKTVSGNLADSNVYFEMEVTFTADTGKTVESEITISGGSNNANPTSIKEDDWKDGVAKKTIYLKAGDTLTFDNIPAGVDYTVVENAKHILQAGETFDPNSAHDKQYTATYTNGSGEIAKNETDAAVVNNDKKTTVSTGIVMDSVPFVVMAVVAVIGLAAFTAKKRVQE